MNKKTKTKHADVRLSSHIAFFNAPPYTREKKELRRSAWGVRLISDFTRIARVVADNTVVILL